MAPSLNSHRMTSRAAAQTLRKLLEPEDSKPPPRLSTDPASPARKRKKQQHDVSQRTETVPLPSFSALDSAAEPPTIGLASPRPGALNRPTDSRGGSVLNSNICPHTMTALRTTRGQATGKEQCLICFEEYYQTPEGRGQIIPVRMACGHVFCKDCIELHRSCEIKCPMPWCDVQVSVKPDNCELCSYWVRGRSDSVVLTVRSAEMTSSIDDALQLLCQDHDFFQLSKGTKRQLLAWVRQSLKRFEWQFHPASDLAEILDPFLLADDPEIARQMFGRELGAPAPDPNMFPPRTNDPDDYPQGEEPWIAAFFRQWASEYEQENGEVKEGWGVLSRTMEEADGSWDWPYKRIVGHRSQDDGTVLYLVKWAGKRHSDSWVSKEQLGYGKASTAYDEAHGLNRPALARSTDRKRKRV